MGKGTAKVRPPRRARGAAGMVVRSGEAQVEPLSGAVMISEIRHALARIVDPGDPRFEVMARAAICPDPPFELIEQLLTDAPRVLRGEPRAGERFRQTVELFQSEVGHHAHPVLARSASLLAPFGEIGRPHEHGAHGAAGAPVVPLSRMVPLMAAASYLDPDGDLLGAVLGRVCELESFAFVHRAAREAVRDPEALRRFEGIVKLGGGECGPIDQPLPPRPRPRCDPSMAAYLECARDVANRFRSAAPTYTIAEVAPARACPGTLLRLRGRGFGERAGVVVFNRRGGGQIEVRARIWSDTAIEVRVPEGASCGLGLVVLDRTEEVCDRLVQVYRRADLRADFLGTAPEILDLRVNGRADPHCVVPNSTLTLSWEVCAADRIRVELVDESGVVLASRSPAATSGSFNYALSPMTRTQRIVARIHAEGTCTPPTVDQSLEVWVHRAPRLSVDGLEVTQGIQYYHAAQHLTDPLDRGADNSVQLVADKAAWVRVYLRSGQDPNWDDGQLAGVTGTLRVERIANGVATLLGTLNPEAPGTVTAEAAPAYAIERGTLGNTLNFRLPRAYMQGRLRINAFVRAALPCGEATAVRGTTVDVALRQTLRVAGIAVGYNGPSSPTAAPGSANLVIAPPTLQQLNQTLPYTLTTYPVARSFRSRIAGTITLTVPLNDPRSCPGCCSTNWNTALALVQAAATADGNRAGWLYYGLLATGVPLGVPGCGQNGGVGGGGVGNQPNMAHELGHQLGRQHTPCGNTGAADPAYPAYEPYDPAGVPQASIGEYGLDIRDGTLHPPTDKDIMSYCGPQWISLYAMQRFLNHASLDPTSLPAGGAGAAETRVAQHAQQDAAEPMPMISLIGSLGTDAVITMRSVARVVTRPEVRGGRATEWIAELLDAHDAVLASASVHALQTAGGCGCAGAAASSGEPAQLAGFGFQALLADVKGGVRLRLRAGTDTRWERAACSRRPWVEAVRCQRGKQSWTLSWRCGFDPEATPEIWIQWSADRGKTWQVLAVGVQGTRHSFDPALFPAGPVRLRVLAHDGFATATAQSATLTMSARAPVVTILEPRGELTPSNERTLLLWGEACDCHGEALPDDQLRWTLDGKEIGRGGELLLPPERLATASRGQLVLHARDRHGHASDSVHLRSPRPARPRPRG